MCGPVSQCEVPHISASLTRSWMGCYISRYWMIFLYHSLTRCFPMTTTDPKHTLRVAKVYYQENGIKWWQTPASSANFNPIERVWRELKYFIARHVKPLTKKDLVDGIRLFWAQRMTPEKCTKYIRHTFQFFRKLWRRKVESLENNILLLFYFITVSFISFMYMFQSC